MSQSRPNIGPPPPRRLPDPPMKPTNLIRENRSSGGETSAPVQAREPGKEEGKKQITFYIPGPDRQRAKAAYKATSSQENDDSWSDFVARALMNEVKRREAAYNNGERFPGGDTKLAPGRRLSSS